MTGRRLTNPLHLRRRRGHQIWRRRSNRRRIGFPPWCRLGLLCRGERRLNSTFYFRVRELGGETRARGSWVGLGRPRWSRTCGLKAESTLAYKNGHKYSRWVGLDLGVGVRFFAPPFWLPLRQSAPPNLSQVSTTARSPLRRRPTPAANPAPEAPHSSGSETPSAPRALAGGKFLGSSPLFACAS